MDCFRDMFRRTNVSTGRKLVSIPIVISALLIWAAQPALAQFTQQGPKLVGTGIAGNPAQGNSVALSADGNTAIVGGNGDNAFAGAAWVFTRSGGVWSQQGAKLVGTGAVADAAQGHSVALSADGNTAIVGGKDDDGNNGAVWIFTRSGGVWTQQGGKLVGTGAVGLAEQGTSVALSGDGNTAIVGGPGDSHNNIQFSGAVWVYTRGQFGWTQQGAKLTGDTGAKFGTSVALSADGNTAIVGEPAYNSNQGAVAVFTRSGGVWSLQNGLIADDAVGAAGQGISVALSADGGTTLVGGSMDNASAGAAWVFTRSGSSLAAARSGPSRERN